MAWALLLLVVTLPIFTTRRVIRRLDGMEEEQLAHVRRQATSTWPAWYIRAWAGLLLAAGVAAAVRGKTGGAVIALLVAATLLVAPLLLSRRNDELLHALGDRGRTARTDRYHRRDRRSVAWGSLVLLGWFVSNLSDIVLPDGGPDDWTWLNSLGTTATVVGAVGWLSVRTHMYLAGDDLAEPTEQDRDGRRG